jgi:hypothetical protein
MPSVGFKPTISAGQRPQTYGFDRAANGTGFDLRIKLLNSSAFVVNLSAPTFDPSQDAAHLAIVCLLLWYNTKHVKLHTPTFRRNVQLSSSSVRRSYNSKKNLAYCSRTYVQLTA